MSTKWKLEGLGPVRYYSEPRNFNFEDWGIPGPVLSDTEEYCAVTHFDDPVRKRKKNVYEHFIVNDVEQKLCDEYVNNVGYDEKYYVTTSNRENQTAPQSEFSEIQIEIQNRSELGETRKVRFDGTESAYSVIGSNTDSNIDSENGTVTSDSDEVSSLISRPISDVTELFDNLGLDNFYTSPVDTGRSGQQTEQVDEEDTNSLADIDDNFSEEEKENLESEINALTEERQNVSPISDRTMSREARFAIIETLQDMKGKGNQDSVHADIRNKGVTAQKRLHNNRLKYNKYKTMAETKNLFIERDDSRHTVYNNRRGSMSRYKSFDSEGETAIDDYSSAELNTRDGSSSAEEVQTKKKGKLLPSINNKRKSPRRLSSAATRYYTLEKAKMTNYRIPGIGKFNIVASPTDDFRITPPGFDSRYEPQPIIYKEERESPPEDILAKSINKCKKWLRNVHLSPLNSLQPAHK